MIKRLTLYLFLISLIACGKEEDNCSYSSEFCNSIEYADYATASTYMNNFLVTLDANLSDEAKINLLENWLKCKPCVRLIENPCISCMFSNPPQSYIEINVLVKGQIVKNTIYILMSKTPIGRISE
ncbi:MAG: hypothetical protein JNL75_07765 [Chitinophagales bacterium]|nr:hypothetical protein [Chitinophagales bacterium]